MGQGTYARAISQTGKVVGTGSAISGAANSYETHAFQWTKTTGMVNIGVSLGFAYSNAVGINSSGEVVGYTSRGHGFEPFRWSEARGMELLTSLDNYFPTAINDAGQILLVLESQSDPDYLDGASVLSATGVKTDIIKCNMCNAAAWAINGSGAVAGTDGKHAFVWTSDGGIRLIPGIPAGVTSSAATGINDNGTVIGTIYSTSSQLSPFIWSASGGYREIAAPAGQTFIYFAGINNKDQIVGYVR